MKRIYLITIVASIFTINLFSQVLDSTFGIPSSFYGNPNSSFVYGTTACDFEGRSDQAIAALHLDDGKIILAGYTSGADGTDFAMARLLPDGQYDQTAGPDGQMRLDLGYPKDSCLAAVRYQSDKVLMGGCVTLPGHTKYMNLIVRTDLDGQLDSTFGNNGQIVIDLPTDYEMVQKILVQSDGKILILGNVFYGWHYTFPDSTNIFVGRLLPDGAIDSTFGTNGFRYQHFEHICHSTLLGAAVLDASGRLVLTGASYDPYPHNYGGQDYCRHNIYICRYLTNGDHDLAFGVNGEVQLPFTEGRGTALYIGEDEKILMAGIVSDFLLLPYRTFVARFMSDGTPDSTFANNGRFTKFIFANGDGSEPIGIIKQGDKIILGIVTDPGADQLGFGALCLHENGQIDTTFGNYIYTKGLFLFFPNPLITFANSITTIENGSFFLSGYYRILSPNNMFICKVKYSQTSATVETNQTADFNLFPNPANGQTNIYIPGCDGAEVKIWNVAGQLVQEYGFLLGDVVHPVPTATWAAGVYIVAAYLHGKGKPEIKKLVVAR